MTAGHVAEGLPGFGAPQAGFEVPLEMLSACHGRVERQCQTLRRLVPHLAAHGPDTDARKAAAAVMRYFDTSARHHHEDEEHDLFPALLKHATGDALAPVTGLVAQLLREHRLLEQRWLRVRAVLQEVAQGHAAPLAAAEVEALVTLYEAHIAREEGELLPLAARWLSGAPLEAIGRAMRERRGVALPV
jgi:hemerythrin-like domain-containing protein